MGAEGWRQLEEGEKETECVGDSRRDNEDEEGGSEVTEEGAQNNNTD